MQAKGKKIEWLASVSPATVEALEQSNLASVRLRTAVSYKASQSNGFDCKVTDGHEPSKPKALIVGKIDAISDPGRAQRWLNHIARCKANGSRIIIDYTDHHLAHTSVASSFYSQALKLADLTICSSQKLKKHLSPVVIGNIDVIEDPVEVPFFDPKPSTKSEKTILWFGHASNLEPLIQCLRENFDQQDHARLIIITNAYPFPDAYSRALDVPQLENIEINVIPWSVDSLVQASRISDLCIIPADIENSRKNGASSNRLITALALGLPTLATPIDSYQPLSKYFTVLSKDSIKGALDSVAPESSLLKDAQCHIRANFSKAAISEKWTNAISSALQASPESRAVIAPQPHAESSSTEKLVRKVNFKQIAQKPEKAMIRLNLGCGDKILDGYINVDVVESRAGKKPDVLSDLRELHAFEDNMADEVMAVHVVEHFWQWEIVDILKEWTRVLKPGGKMILECPNLISAAEEFLKNPDHAAIGGKEGQRSMWVFYGDPAWRDPLMIHRWGYTPRSLAATMEAAGLTALRQEPAQFKLREPRDMRITGIKPLQ